MRCVVIGSGASDERKSRGAVVKFSAGEIIEQKRKGFRE